MKFAVIATSVCAIVVAMIAGIVVAAAAGEAAHGVVWVRPHALENESIVLFDNGTFAAQFSFDIGPSLKSSGHWNKRQDLATEQIVLLEPTPDSGNLADSYRHLFVRVLPNGEPVLVPGIDVAAFDAGDRFSESSAFHRKIAGAAR